MKCPKCKTENREERNFCGACGAKLLMVCPECGFENLPAEKFCGKCGYQLAKLREAQAIDYSDPQSYTPKPLANKILTDRRSIEGERKLVTVLFADVANYTSMSEKLDPEEVHQIMDGCFRILMDEIHKYEGTITQFTGDGAMALFGAPIAHEDHAQRACYTGLAIQKALAEYGEKVKKERGLDFKMRIGLNSGPVVVGSIGDDLRVDYTAIGDTTNLAARVEQAAKPGEVWMSQETRNIIWGYFKEESVGEPGVGKSRLVYEFRKVLGADETFLTGFCVPFGRNINFLPVIDVVKAAFGIVEGMTEEEVGNRIKERSEDGLAPMVPFFRNLLSLKVDDPRFNALDPEGRKFGTFEAVKSLLLAMSEEKPVVIFLEDVHWMDKISEEFFTYFSHCIHGYKILMISAYRPEGAAPWAQGAHYQRLGLETLSFDASIRLVRNILGGLPLDPALEKKIVEKTGGNPFFVEEILRDLLDRGELVKSGDRYICNRPINQLEIPNTIQGVLAARMDRLSEDLKQTMQVASVIGKDFAFRLLKSIMELGEELRVRLTSLVGLEILYEKALYPELEYIFKNVLTQEVAYESLLKQRRREIHGRIARAIEELYAHRLEPHYELLAHHYERSGNAEKAVQYLILAGERSWKNMAVQAANEFFGAALKVAEGAKLSLDPGTASRAHHMKGSASYYMGNTDEALEELGKAAEISRRHGIVEIEKDSLVFLGFSVLNSSMKDEEALRFFDQAIARARDLGQKGTESGILSSQGMCLCYFGHLYQGYQMIVEAERLARGTEDQVAIFRNRTFLALSERWMGRPGKALELTEGIIEGLRGIFSFTLLPFVIWFRALALADTGRIEEAMLLFREGIEICEKSGHTYFLVRLYNCLGYCYSEIYQPRKAWNWNVRGEEMARNLMLQYPMGRQMSAEAAAHASVNLMENLFDQGNPDGAWDRIKSLETETESKGDDFARLRDIWYARMDYLASQILLQRENVDQAESIITKNLEKSQREHMRKNEGRFLRLFGEVQMKRSESDSAIRGLSEALLILREVGNPRQLWQAYASLGSAYDKLGRVGEAREQWGAAAEVIQKTANGLSDRELREGFLSAKPIRDILAKAGN